MLEDHEAARERWLNDEIPKRYDDLINNSGMGVPADAVRARFEAKRRSVSAK